MPNLTGGQAITESLKAQGVDTVFGIISIHNLDLFDALFDQQDNLRFIGGRLELGVGFMADGYARATGKPRCVDHQHRPRGGGLHRRHGRGLLLRLAAAPGDHQRRE